MSEGTWKRVARRWPESILVLLACAMFLGFLGSVDLWGKREQRASAEAIDTIDHAHWLIAKIQGRPRLEKPPLPRWVVAGLMRATGRRDEWIVRLPAALSALGMIGLTYSLARRVAGREAALASGFFLVSNPFFVLECRQGGNDPPLAFFTTLALYAAWRRLADVEIDGSGSRRWNLLLYLSMGLGFLTKGPIVVVIVAMTIAGYLASARRIRAGAHRLWDAWGCGLFVVLAMCWPLPVCLVEPRAIGVWLLEMARKTISMGIGAEDKRELLALAWPGLTAPWTFVTLAGAMLPFVRKAREKWPDVWFPWWCVLGNLAMFCCWRSAKPSYYLPCSPAVAILSGIAWVALSKFARTSARYSFLARNTLIGHAIGWLAVAALGPIGVWRFTPEYFAWSFAGSFAILAAVALATIAWKRGAIALTLAPVTAAFVFISLILYGILAPPLVAERGQRSLAKAIDRALPVEARRVMFFHQIDEGLWFYLRDRELKPVPGSAPELNDGVVALQKIQGNVIVRDSKQRVEQTRKVFLDWLRSTDRTSDYCLMLARDYDDAIAAELAGMVTPIFRETESPRDRGPSKLLRRNGIVLLHVEPFGSSIARSSIDAPIRR